MSAPLKLFRFPLSGHSHRAELFLSLLQLDYELVDVDLPNGAHKEPEFLAMNPFGQVPVLKDGDTVIYDSNAILVYLAKKYDKAGKWLPEGEHEVQSWLSVAAGQLAFGPCSARLITVFGAELSAEATIALSHQLFAVMEGRLADQNWLVGNAPTIADVALYTYTAHAPEGNVSLADYPSVRNWLERVEKLEGFTPMQATKVGLAA